MAEVVDVFLEEGDEAQGAFADEVGQACDGFAVADGEFDELGVAVFEAVAHGCCGGWVGAAVCCEQGVELGVVDGVDVGGFEVGDDAVDDEDFGSLVEAGEFFVEVDGFLDAAWVGAGDDEEVGVGVAEDKFGDVAALFEGFLQVLEGVEKFDEVFDKFFAEEFSEQANRE